LRVHKAACEADVVQSGRNGIAAIGPVLDAAIAIESLNLTSIGCNFGGCQRRRGPIIYVVVGDELIDVGQLLVWVERMQAYLSLARRSRFTYPHRLKPDAVPLMFENDLLAYLDFRESDHTGALGAKIKRTNHVAPVVPAGIYAQSAHWQGKRISLFSASGHRPRSMALLP